MARNHRRIKTGKLVARALDNTFTGTTHIVAIIEDGRTGFASLDGPNGFPNDNGKVVF